MKTATTTLLWTAALAALVLGGCYVPKHVPYDGSADLPASPRPPHGTAPLEKGATNEPMPEPQPPEDQPPTTQPPEPVQPSTAPGQEPAATKPPLVKLFGVTVRASHVVYVVDRSQSTIPHWDMIRMGLSASIGDLWLDQDFCLVLMGDRQPMQAPAKALSQGKKHNQALAVRAMLDTEPAGKTDPAAALKAAFALLRSADGRPGKVVYFLTDRAFLDKGMTELVEVLDRDRDVQVMTFMVGKGTPQTAEVLEAMARAGDGKFTRLADR